MSAVILPMRRRVPPAVAASEPDLSLDPPARSRVEPGPLAGLPLLREHGLTGAAILAARDEPIVWAWHGIAAQDHHVEIAGPSYSGKTTLAALLLVAAANPTGEPVEVLGRVVEPNPAETFAVLVEEENSRRSIARKLVASAEMLGLPVAETLDRILLLARTSVLAHPITEQGQRGTKWDEILALGQEGRIGLLVLDSRARILGGGESKDERDQAFAQRVLHQAIQYCECPVVVISHTRKTGAETIEDIAGSMQRGAGPDTILLVTAEREEGEVLSSKVVFAKLRDGEDEHPKPVSFDIAKDEGGAWRLAVNASARSEDQPAHERVFALLQRDGGKTKNELREAFSLSGDRVEKALSVLFSERRIKKSKRLVRGQQRDVFTVRAARRDAFNEAFDDAEARRKGVDDEC